MTNTMIEQSVERLFTEHVTPEVLRHSEKGEFASTLWQHVEESGFTLALVPEEMGGIGENWTGAAYPIFRGVGYWQTPLPLAETMVAAQLMSMVGMALEAGPIALAQAPEDGLVQVQKSSTAQEVILNGKLSRVPWARHCKKLLIGLSDGRLALVDLSDHRSVEIVKESDYAGQPKDTVVLHSAKAISPEQQPIPNLLTPVRTLAAAAYSIQIVGAMERLLDESVRYANDRVQFGKPIGKNQAIQQQIALLAGDMAATRTAAMIAAQDMPDASKVDAGRAWFSAAVAKIRAGEAASNSAAIAHQVHGAIGFTYEHHLHFATRRLLSWRELYGSDAQWAKMLGQNLIRRGGAHFWSAITNRSVDSNHNLSHAHEVSMK